MLNNLRDNAKSTVMTVLFGIIILVFVLQFGQSGGASCSSSASNSYVASVFGRDITKEEMAESRAALGGPTNDALGIVSRLTQQIAVSMRGFDSLQNAERITFDFIVMREILASSAEELGFSISDDQIDAEILEPTLPGRPSFLKDGAFTEDSEREFTDYVQYSLQFSMKEYRAILRRQLLAQKMANYLMQQAHVSNDEIEFEFRQQETKVDLEFVKIFVAGVRESVIVSDGEAETYYQGHPDAVKKYYDDHQDEYGAQVKARHILIKVKEKASDADVAAAQKRADDVYAEVTKEGADFGKIAEEKSEDKGSATKGGDLGFFSKGQMVPEFEKASFEAAAGTITQPIRSQFGFHIIKVEEKKDAVAFDAVKIEISKKLAVEDKAKNEAKAQAEALLAKAKALPPTEGLASIIPNAAPAAPAPASAPASAPAETPASAPTESPYALKVLSTDPQPLTQLLGFSNFNNLGNSPELAKALSKLSATTPVADQVFEIGDTFVVARLKARTDPDMSQFQTKLPTLRESALLQKQVAFLSAWLQAEYKKAEEDGAIVTHDPKLSLGPVQLEVPAAP